MDLLEVKTIPLAAAITIRGDTIPPPSLTLFKITAPSDPFHHLTKTCLPRFFAGSSESSPPSSSVMFSFIPSK